MQIRNVCASFALGAFLLSVIAGNGVNAQRRYTGKNALEAQTAQNERPVQGLVPGAFGGGALQTGKRGLYPASGTRSRRIPYRRFQFVWQIVR